MNRLHRSAIKMGSACALAIVLAVGSLSLASTSAVAATTAPELSLNVLLVGTGSTDPTTAAWESALTDEGVAYTEATASGTYGAETVTLPALTTGSVGNFDAVVIADSPAGFASGQLTSLFSYESTYQVRQVDGYTAPYTGIGEDDSSTAAVLDSTNGTLTAAGLAGLAGLAGTVPFSTGTNGYPATAEAGAAFTPWLDSSTGSVLAGLYQHPSTDPQAGVSELALNFDYNATDLQWELLAPGLINWVTDDTHLGLDRNYVEMDIDDTFTPDNAWSTSVHDNDYSDADSLRMQPADVVTAANWSAANDFRMDQLFNFGGTDEYQADELDLPGETTGPDPLLAEFQATDPTTKKPYSDDFGWLSHTYDTPYLDVGCATENYIEAELNQNTSEAAAAPGTTPGTGGLGLTESTDTADALGYENPQVFVPGNHSGFADLVPGTPATVDPPDLDEATSSTTGGTLAAGTYEYAVTDQFNSADSTSVDQSQAYVTDGEQGDLAPVVVTGSTGSVSLVWQAICHADDYIVYRAPVTAGVVGSWSEIGTLSTPSSATLPDNSSGNPTSTTNVSGGGELELTFTDTGAAGTPEAAGWTPPVVENAQETPWEQNPYFIPALEAVGITTVGADASKAYPDPPTATFGTGDVGGSYTGATYAAGVPFVDGTAQVAPRHPINIFYNASTEAQEVDEYNTLYDADAPDSQCKSTSTTTCSTTPFTFSDIVNQVVTGMLQNMLSNNPEPTYVHQTNLMGTVPYTGTLPPANYTPPATADTTGDGLLYSVLNPLLADYHTYYTSATPYEQPTLGGIGTVLGDQTNWATALAAGTVKATEQDGVVTVTNTGTSAVNVPVTAPDGTTTGGAAYGTPYAGALSTWTSVAAGGSLVLDENQTPTITSAAAATSIVGAAFTATVTTTGDPAPSLTETGALPAGLAFVDNGNGTATISGTPSAGSGGSYPITITATNASGTTTQAFTLTNAEAPTITSPSAVSFSDGVAGSYTVTTTGFPDATITETGTLPAGLTFTVPSPATGEATISGTTTAKAGTYPVTISATNSSGSVATLALTITVGASSAPAITSPSTAYFTLGQSGAIAVTTTGSPTPTITESGALPAGLTFDNEGNGSALISGTPTATGTTTLAITASDGVSPNATENLSIVVGQVPAFTSAASASVVVGQAFSFAVTTSGYPAPSLGVTGTLPAGVTFVSNGNGTGTLAGTPTGTAVSTFTISAVNGTGTTTQIFTLTALAAGVAPAFTSAASTTATQGKAFTFAVAATGTPTPTLTETGTLPAGVTFVSNGNGTGTLAGTPTGSGVSTFELVATNSAGTTTQSFTLTTAAAGVAPAFTSAASTTATQGKAFTFAVAATGTPTPTLTETGTLPAGVTFKAATTGKATISGTPTGSGVSTFELVATNSAGTTTQSFTLTTAAAGVAPAFTSAASTTATQGKAFTFAVTTTGSPTPTLTETGTLPAGVTFVSNGNGAGTLAGTPTGSGASTFKLVAANTTGTTTQSFTLTTAAAGVAPAFTSAASTTATEGKALTFTVTTTGTPTPTLTETGTLPAGVTFKSATTGKATVSGTPTTGGVFTLTLSAKNTVATTTQSFTLTVDQVPKITSSGSEALTIGKAATITITATGYPTATITETGTLPKGLTFKANTNGTATITGTPTSIALGDVTVHATNSSGTATLTLLLLVI